MDHNQIQHVTTGISIGFTSALAIGTLSSLIVLHRRVKHFERIKGTKSKLPSWFSPSLAPPIRSDLDRQRDEAMRQMLATLHRDAKVLQDQTLAQLVGASTTLLAAFIATVLSVTLWRDSELLHIASAAFDLAALAYAFFSYIRSGRYRVAWLRKRALAEILRQWFNVDYLLASHQSPLTGRVEGLLAAWQTAINQTPEMFVRDVAALAQSRIEELTLAVTASCPSDEALRTYWVARPQRQVRWFENSLERLERSHHTRGISMLTIFVGAGIASCIKFVALLVHNETAVNVAMLVLLACIGLTGASSSTYLSQNKRSLKHRYAQQLRAIEEWLKISNCDGLAAYLGGNAQVPHAAIVRDIRAFERLMVVELLDWLTISTDDAMELAAS